MCYLLKKYFLWLLRWVSRISDRRHVNTTENEISPTDIFISNWFWPLSMVQYLQNNVSMKWTTRFTSFNGWIPLKYGSTTTPPIIAHSQNLRCQASNFTLRSPKTSIIRGTQSFDLLPDEFSKRVYYKTRLILETRRYIAVPLLGPHQLRYIESALY